MHVSGDLLVERPLAACTAVSDSPGYLAGVAQAGQAVEGAGGIDEVADLLAEVGRLLEPGPGGGQVASGSPPPAGPLQPRQQRKLPLSADHRPPVTPEDTRNRSGSEANTPRRMAIWVIG